ncbi:cytochrome c biogenesis CcdA family protein [Cellulomonas sp. 179-A 4D5 NHS]|uniref:cytochrome c biogenesis CcdA family protein n=1 Tax=Cellulomonas sp. 179-A 4D5 NHS TaxID=3142378 RepID=UPI0039A10057
MSAALTAADIGTTFATVAFSGTMLLAVPVALLAGVVSFASPCVLPLVPGYLGYLGGMSGAALGASTTRPSPGRAEQAGADLAGPEPARPRRGRLLAGVALFVGGFTAVFVTLGVLAGSLGASLVRWQGPVTQVLGVVVIVLGLSFLGFIPFLQRDLRPHATRTAGLWGAPVLGLVFGLGWTPCIGPTLAAVMALSLDEGSPSRGAILSVAYGLGLGLPFLLIALSVERSSRVLTMLRRHRLLIARAGGALLVLIGLALATGLWSAWTQSLQGLIGGFQTAV